eukprot:173419-Karenia_brevis.AAC.1
MVSPQGHQEVPSEHLQDGFLYAQFAVAFIESHPGTINEGVTLLLELPGHLQHGARTVAMCRTVHSSHQIREDE